MLIDEQWQLFNPWGSSHGCSSRSITVFPPPDASCFYVFMNFMVSCLGRKCASQEVILN